MDVARAGRLRRRVLTVGALLASRDAKTNPALGLVAPAPPVEVAPTPSPAPGPVAPALAVVLASPAPEPATLELRLSSSPNAAKVEVDGLLVGHTPLVVTGLEGTTLTLTLSAPGFSRLERRVLMTRRLPDLSLELEKLRASPRPPAKSTKPQPGLYDNPWE